jgi:hypothetical protein
MLQKLIVHPKTLLVVLVISVGVSEDWLTFRNANRDA